MTKYLVYSFLILMHLWC